MPSEYDALVKAPQHHRLVFEDGQVRVLETKVMPGETVPPHTHEWSSLNYVLGFAPFIRRDEHGNVMVDSQAQGIAFSVGEAFRSGPLPIHTLENVGAEPIHILSIEFKPVA